MSNLWYSGEPDIVIWFIGHKMGASHFRPNVKTGGGQCLAYIFLSYTTQPYIVFSLIAWHLFIDMWQLYQIFKMWRSFRILRRFHFLIYHHHKTVRFPKQSEQAKMALSKNELFSLKWAEFQPFISNSVRGLREVRDFTDVTLVFGKVSWKRTFQVGDFSDVTLVCEDGELEAHRVILSACSSFFHRVRLCGSWSFLIECMSGVQEVWAATANDIHARGEYLFLHLTTITRSKNKNSPRLCPKVEMSQLTSLLDFIYTGEVELPRWSISLHL